MTALETPDIQKKIVRGHVTDKTISQAMPELVLLWQIRWRMQRLTWEQTKRDKERMLLYEVMDVKTYRLYARWWEGT